MRRLAGIGVGAGGTLFGHMVASLPSRSYTPSLRNTVSPAPVRNSSLSFLFFFFFSLFNRYLFSSLLSLSLSFGRNVCFGVDEPEGSKKNPFFPWFTRGSGGRRTRFHRFVARHASSSSSSFSISIKRTFNARLTYASACILLDTRPIN